MASQTNWEQMTLFKEQARQSLLQCKKLSELVISLTSDNKFEEAEEAQRDLDLAKSRVIHDQKTLLLCFDSLHIHAEKVCMDVISYPSVKVSNLPLPVETKKGWYPCDTQMSARFEKLQHSNAQNPIARHVFCYSCFRECKTHSDVAFSHIMKYFECDTSSPVSNIIAVCRGCSSYCQTSFPPSNFEEVVRKYKSFYPEDRKSLLKHKADHRGSFEKHKADQRGLLDSHLQELLRKKRAFQRTYEAEVETVKDLQEKISLLKQQTEDSKDEIQRLQSESSDTLSGKNLLICLEPINLLFAKDL